MKNAPKTGTKVRLTKFKDWKGTGTIVKVVKTYKRLGELKDANNEAAEKDWQVVFKIDQPYPDWYKKEFLAYKGTRRVYKGPEDQLFHPVVDCVELV